MSKKLAYFSIIFVCLLTALAGLQLPKLSFNYIFEDFFPIDDPDLITYREFTENFETDNDYLLLGLINKKGVFNNDFLIKVDSITKLLDTTDGIKNVNSITSFKQPIISPAGVYEVPLVHINEPNRLIKDSIRAYRQTKITETLLSKDGKSTLIVIKHHSLDTKESADQLVAKILLLADQQAFDDYFMAGKLYAQGVFIDKIQDELLTFVSASIFLVILFLAYTYRSISGIVIPLLVVSLSTVWILGLMSAVGKQLDLLMVLLPTIMFVVGMSDVVHLMTKYIENLRRGDHKSLAIKTALKEVGLATFLTSFTTAVGFLTLLTASIRPIQEFGIYTAAGVLIAFLAAFTIIPAAWVLQKEPSVSAKQEHRSFWFRLLSRSLIYVSKKPKEIIVICLLICIVSSFGISKIIINTYLIEDLPADDPLKQSFTFFDDQFGGSRPFEAIIEVQEPKATLFDSVVINEVEKVNHYLEKTYEVGGLISTNTVIKSLNQAVNGGNYEFYNIPNESGYKRISKPLKRLVKKEELDGMLYANNVQTGRITGWIDDIGSAISLQKIEDFNEFVKQNVNTNTVDFKITGTSLLIDKNNIYLAKNMLQGLGIAFAVVALIAGLLFKSARMVLITLIPNIIPLLMVAGIMGLFGITLKLSTSIVFTIAFGIAVDDTIHFTSKLKLELDKGKSLLYALKRTYLSTGKAIIVTSLILSGGFLILILSSFGGTFYTGLLISLTLMFALIIDLTLLPAFIILFFNRTKLKQLTEPNEK